MSRASNHSGNRRPAPSGVSGIHWHFPAEHQALAAALADGDWHRHAQLVARSRRHSVYLVQAPALPAAVWITHHHPTSWRERLGNLWSCRTAAQYEAGLALSKAGVPTVSFLGWGRWGWESILVTGAVLDARPATVAWLAARGSPRRRNRFLQAACRLVSHLCDAGVRWSDLGPDDVLARLRDGDDVKLMLATARRLEIGKPLDSSAKQMLLLWVAGLPADLLPDERTRLLRAAALPSASPEAAREQWQGVCDGLRLRLQSQWPAQRQRLLRESRVCRRYRTQDGSWLLRRPFMLDLAEDIYAEHRHQRRHGLGVVKDSSTHTVTRVAIDGRSYIVKEFKKATRVGRLDLDARTWLSAHRVAGYGQPTPTAHAWLRTATGRGHLILEDFGPQLLPVALAATDDGCQRRRWLRALGLTLSNLHQFHIVHRRLEPASFVVRADGSIGVVALDGMRFNVRIGAAHRQHAVTRILKSLPSSVSKREKLNFLAAYRQAAGLDRRDILTLVAQLEKTGIV